MRSRLLIVTPLPANTEKGLLDHYSMVAKRLRCGSQTRAPAIPDEVQAELPAIAQALADGVIKAIPPQQEEMPTGFLATFVVPAELASMAAGASDATKINIVIEAMKLPSGIMNRLQRLLRIVSEVFNISVGSLKSSARTAGIVRPRQIAMAIAYHLKLGSMPAIGRAFGNKDHTTVLHSVRKMCHLVDEAVASFQKPEPQAI